MLSFINGAGKEDGDDESDSADDIQLRRQLLSVSVKMQYEIISVWVGKLSGTELYERI